MKAKAYSYIRFSSPEQAKGDSYRRQRVAAESYCMANGLEFVDSKEYLFFDKGRSAYKAKHLDDTGELARFLSYVENGAISAGSFLIVESLDRLSREKVKDALPRFLDLLNKGINIYTSADCRLYTSDVDELDLFASIIHMSRAHSESSIKGHRISKAWGNKQARARESLTPLGAACPYWLKLENGAYALIPERVDAIKQIFDLALGGIGQRLIAKTLNAEGVPIFGSTNRNKSGAWGSSSVGKILCNRALLGEYQPTGIVEGERQKIGEPVQGFYPIVVLEEIFYAAAKSRNEKLVSKATKPSINFNVWQGIAKCELCSESMHLVNKGTPPKGSKYLRCYGAAKGVCRGKLVRLDRSEEIFREILAKVDSLSLVQDHQGKLKKGGCRS
ncbi:recombinase family protein [Pseudomonas sp. TMP9]|uniref:recombinase family protein n=1 Tax=Pseudomonas sp. TMP9 TaxID=3133144 RepID=UPI0030D48584